MSKTISEKCGKFIKKIFCQKNTLMFNFYQYPLKKTKFTGVSTNSTKIVTCLFAFTQYYLVVQFATDMMPFDKEKNLWTEMGL